MKAARVRIVRVKLKAGGSLRLLERPPEGRIVGELRKFVRQVEVDSRWDGPPSAFMAIAFWPGGAEPYRLPYVIGWDTIEGTLPLPLLAEVAPAQLRTEGVARIVEGRVMRAMGYVETDDDPDDAA